MLQERELARLNVPPWDWGYEIERFMETARREISALGHTAKFDLLKAKHDLAKGLSGGDTRSYRDAHFEYLAYLVAAFEQSLGESYEYEFQCGRAHSVSEIIGRTEELRYCESHKEPYVHQLKMESLLEALSGAVVFLLTESHISAAARTSDEGTPVSSPTEPGSE